MNNASNNKRIEYIDIARGICLILVVWAHSRAPFQRFIYQFHMPFFFLVSGYLHKSTSDTKDFIIKRIKRIYIPFAFWNILCTVIRFFVEKTSLRKLVEFSAKVLLTIEKDGTFLGATWFLGALFSVSVGYKIIEDISKKINVNLVEITLLYVAIGVFGFLVTIRYKISRTLILAMFYAIGVYLRNSNIDLKPYCTRFNFIATLLIFAFIGYDNSCNMGENRYSNPIAFVITSLTGSFAIIAFSYFISVSDRKWLSTPRRLLVWVGHRGVDLIIWQFVGFWFVTAFQFWKRGQSFDGFFSNSAIAKTSNGWWLIYFIVGLFFPLLISFILRMKPWGSLLKRLHIVND